MGTDEEYSLHVLTGFKRTMSLVGNVPRKKSKLVYILYDIRDKAIQGYARPHLKASTVLVIGVPRKIN